VFANIIFVELGNELPVEFIQTLLKMAPTPEEELKLRLYCGEIAQLGSAERFLKAVVDIPFAFKRLEALLFMCTLHEEMAFVKESFQTLEVRFLIFYKNFVLKRKTYYSFLVFLKTLSSPI